MRVAPDFLAPLLEGFADPDGIRRLLPDLLQRSRQAPRRNRADAGLVGGRRSARAAPIDERSTRCIPASTAAAGPAPSTATSFSSSADSTSCSRPSTWKTPTSATWPGSAAGRCSTSRAAWCITNIAAPSGRSSRRNTFKSVLKKNFVLFCWKNIHEWPRLASHFFFNWAGALLGVLFGDSPGAPNLRRPLARLPPAPQACTSRWRAKSLAAGQRHRSVPPAAGRLFS